MKSSLPTDVSPQPPELSVWYTSLSLEEFDVWKYSLSAVCQPELSVWNFNRSIPVEVDPQEVHVWIQDCQLKFFHQCWGDEIPICQLKLIHQGSVYDFQSASGVKCTWWNPVCQVKLNVWDLVCQCKVIHQSLKLNQRSYNQSWCV